MEINEKLHVVKKEIEALLIKNNPYDFVPSIEECSLILRSTDDGELKITINQLDKMTDVLCSEISFYRYGKTTGKNVLKKPRKADYPFYIHFYKVVSDFLVKLGEGMNKRGIVITYNESRLHQDLVELFLESNGALTTLSQYPEEIVELIKINNRNQLLGLQLSKELLEKGHKFLELVPTIKEIIEQEPLLTIDIPNYNHILNLFEAKVCFKYAGQTLVWEIINNEKLAISLLDDNEFELVDVSIQAVNTYLKELKEETKFHQLLNTPKDNFVKLVDVLENVGNRAEVTKTWNYIIKDKTVEREFTKLEKRYHGWEEVEKLSIKLLDKYEKASFVLKEHAFKQFSFEMEEKKNVCEAILYEFFINDEYIYFVFHKKNFKSELEVIVSDMKEPNELKLYLYDVLN